MIIINHTTRPLSLSVLEALSHLAQQNQSKLDSLGETPARQAVLAHQLGRLQESLEARNHNPLEGASHV